MIKTNLNNNFKQSFFFTRHYYSGVSLKTNNINKHFWKKPLNLSDINSGISGIFSKDIIENQFKFNEGSNFQNLILFNNGNNHFRSMYSTNFSFVELNELFLKKDLYSKNVNPLFFLFWEGIPRREVTNLNVLIGNLLYSFGGVSCVLGARSDSLWKSFFIGGGRFKKLSYLSGRSGAILAQRSSFYEGSRTFFSSNSENKGSYLLNDAFSRLRVGGFSYDLHFSLAGLSFIANTENLKDLKMRYYLNFCLAKKQKIKVNSLLLGSFDEKQISFFKNALQSKNIYFLDSYKMSGRFFNQLQTDSINVISIPAEHEATSIVQNLQGNFILASKGITVQSKIVRSFSSISNILVDSFFNKLKNSIGLFFTKQGGFLNNNIQGSYLELKNRIYGLLESKTISMPLLNIKYQRNSFIYLLSETSSNFVQLNICVVDGPSRHSRTMSELNWALHLNKNFS